MTGYSIAFLAGTLGLLKSAGPVVLAAIAIVIALIGGWCRGLRGASWGLVWACLGWVLAWVAASEHLRLRWPESKTNDRVLVEAIVESIPTTEALGTSFDAALRVLSPRHRCGVGLSAPECDDRELRARLLWRDRVHPVRAGERWELLVSLRPPRTRFNPGTVDVELHLFRERVQALGNIVESRLNRRIDAGHRPLTALRERIVRRIEHRVADRDAAALIAALGVGATGEMSREQWRVFNATSTTHLVAISGLHVTLFALIALFIARRLWQFGLWRVVGLPRESFAAWIGLAASTAYALLAGFSVPTQRTLIMLAVWLFARSSARACGPFTILSVALIAVLLLDPFAPLSAGFWLSFSAIAAIVLVTHDRIAQQSRMREGANVQVAVTLALTPITLAAFGSIAISGVLVNVVAIPLFTFVLVPAVLLAIVLMPLGESVSGALLDSTAWICQAMWPPLSWSAESPLALVYVQPPNWWYLAAAISVTLSLMPLPLRIRIACLLWLIPCAVAAPRTPAVGGLDLTVLDVGQGTAVVLRTATHVLIYDVGDAYGGEGRAAEYTLVPFLRSEGVRAVDRIIMSSPEDGSEGLPALLASLPVGHSTKTRWTWDGVSFELLQPRTNSTSHGVMRVTTSQGSVLLAGQVDATAERQLVHSGLPPTDVVLIPRHGSNTASSPEFIAAVAPRWALLSGSRGNKPAIARWSAFGARVLATADSGAIHLHIDPVTGVASPSASRRIHCEIWRGSP